MASEYCLRAAGEGAGLERLERLVEGVPEGLAGMRDAGWSKGLQGFKRFELGETKVLGKMLDEITLLCLLTRSKSAVCSWAVSSHSCMASTKKS
jgi:hypothetical protein